MMDVGLEGNNLRLERGSGNRNTDSVIEKNAENPNIFPNVKLAL
jgi:hypothetical protein